MTFESKTPLQRFAAKLARSAVGRAGIKEAIADVKAGRLLTEEDFFQRLEEKQRTKRLRHLTDLIPSVDMHELRPDQTNLEIGHIEHPVKGVEAERYVRAQGIEQAEKKTLPKRMEKEFVY